MESPSQQSELPAAVICEKFQAIFGSEMVEVPYDELPEVVRDHFESKSSDFISDETYVAGNFTRLYKLRHDNSDETYVAEQNKTYDTNHATEQLTYLADTRDGVITGYLEIRYALTDQHEYFKNKPFVGFTRTNEPFLQTGLGKRRLEVGNSYSLARYSFPLYSDSIIDEKAKIVWESLVKEGKVESYIEDEERKMVRFRFIAN